MGHIELVLYPKTCCFVALPALPFRVWKLLTLWVSSVNQSCVEGSMLRLQHWRSNLNLMPHAATPPWQTMMSFLFPRGSAGAGVFSSNCGHGPGGKWSWQPLTMLSTLNSLYVSRMSRNAIDPQLSLGLVPLVSKTQYASMLLGSGANSCSNLHFVQTKQKTCLVCLVQSCLCNNNVIAESHVRM